MFRLPHEAILRGVRKLACIKTRLYIGHCINAKSPPSLCLVCTVTSHHMIRVLKLILKL